MLRSPRNQQRRGATMVECAIVYPVAFLLLLGLIVGGMGVFRYQEVAWLAREGARYASTHGAQYEQENPKAPRATEQYLGANVVGPMAAAIDPSQLSVQVQWIDNTQSGQATAWDASSRSPVGVITDNGASVTNAVRVTVTYPWLPEVFLVGPISLSSTSEMPMSY